MRRSICFVGLDNYPVLNPEYGDRYFGGESVQQTLLACAFRDLGFDVTMVVGDYGQPDGEVVDGIRVWKAYREGSGIPIVRFVYPKATSIVRAMRRAGSGIYFQSTSAAWTGLVSAFCQVNRRTFIFRVASDADCIRELPLVRYARDRALYRWGLRHADLVSAQSLHQSELLMKSFRRPSRVIDMVVKIPDLRAERNVDIDVLWVNNLRPLKRPEHVIQLARSLPKYRFVIVGGAVPGSEKFYRSIANQAEEVPNLAFVGAVPFHLVSEYFSRSRVFINTSEIEGFPNSILQAWASGLPVVSYFDPDGINKRLRLGDAPSDLEEMSLSVRRYLENTELREETGQRARGFVRGRYSPDVVAHSYIEALALRSG
jgi:glycosyltransferase involved in cell wall biosynthesis